MSQVELVSFWVEQLSEKSDLQGLTLQMWATKSQGFNLTHLKGFCLCFVLKMRSGDLKLASQITSTNPWFELIFNSNTLQLLVWTISYAKRWNATEI